MYANTKANLLDMFLDRTAGETFAANRLITREGESGNVELVAYGWLKIAEYNESRETVTIFTGHKSLDSKTVNQYLNSVTRRAQDRGRDVVLSGESPTVAAPNNAVEFIGNYISMDGEKSPVERDAQRKVRQSLAHVA